jgi:hypothetical protein
LALFATISPNVRCGAEYFGARGSKHYQHLAEPCSSISAWTVRGGRVTLLTGESGDTVQRCSDVRHAELSLSFFEETSSLR